MSRKIPLTQGKIAFVDDEDYERIVVRKWCAVKDGHLWYAMRGTRRKGVRQTFLMHREILGLTRSDSKEVDHINGDGLDNRRANLRIATRAENVMNTGLRRTNRSGFKGVSWRQDMRAWHARIWYEGKSVHLGYFARPESAFEAYRAAVIAKYGKIAVARASEKLV